MDTANFSQAESVNTGEDSLFETFAELQRASGLHPRRRDLVNQFSEYLPKLNLTEAETVTRQLVQDVMSGPAGPFGRAIERQVLASFQYLTQLQSLVPFGKEWFRQAIDDWHAFLDQAVTPEPSSPGARPKYILTAFSLIEDYTFALNPTTLKQLAEDIPLPEKTDNLGEAARVALWRAGAGKNEAGDKLDEGVWNGIDLLAVIIALMTREGLKPAVLTPKLQKWLIGYLTPIATKSLGGAAGNEAYILRQMSSLLGRTVLTATPYHHTEQAQAAPEGTERLIFDQPEVTSFFPPLNQAGYANDARRLSFVLQLTPTGDEQTNLDDQTFVIANQRFLPKLTDRVILRIPRPRTDTSVEWQKLQIIWTGNKHDLTPKAEPTPEDPSTLAWDTDNNRWVFEMKRQASINGEKVFKEFSTHDWPYFPLFQHQPRVDTTNKTLTIELASPDKLKAIATDVQVVLLGAIQMLGKTIFTETLTRLLRTALIEQLKTLSKAGASLHLELSGVASGKPLAQLAELCHLAGIQHISTNREELIQMTSEFGSDYFVAPRPIVPESAFTTYWRAEQLLEKLKLKTYYVHDLELDMLVWRNEPQETLSDVKQALTQHRQAMLLAKAAVPAALIQRAKANQGWKLILSAQSLVALLAFANTYADYRAAKSGVAEANVLEQILRQGYYHHPDRERGYSVVVAPTIVVNFDQSVSMAGAGDMGFAVQAATANLGWHQT